MQTIIILQIIGIVFMGMGFAMAVNPRQIKKDINDMFRESHSLFVMGLLAMIIGAVILTFNHSGNNGWEFFITLFGALAIIEGFLLMAFPEFIMQLKAYYLSKQRYFAIFGWLIFLLGVFLFWNSLTL